MPQSSISGFNLWEQFASCCYEAQGVTNLGDGIGVSPDETLSRLRLAHPRVGVEAAREHGGSLVRPQQHIVYVHPLDCRPLVQIMLLCEEVDSTQVKTVVMA